MRKLLTIAVLLAACASTAFAADNPRIEVSADSRMTVRPDQATMHVSVTAVAKNTEQAIGELKERVAAAQEILKKYKLKDKKVRSSEIEVNANVSHLAKKVLKEGYYAKLELDFTLLDLKQLEELSAKLAEVQGAEFGKPRFGRSDASDLKQQNLKQALANAQAEGKFIADALGVKIGPAVYARETQSYSRDFLFDQGSFQVNADAGNSPFSQVPQQAGQPEAARGVDRLDNVIFVSEVTVHFSIEK